MTIQEVSNIYEMTEAVVILLDEEFKKSHTTYHFIASPNRFEIHNNVDEVVLVIENDKVEIRDVISEAITLHETKKLLEKLSINEEIAHDLIVKQWTTFLYFPTEEETFQQSTIYDNVISYKSSRHITSIKKSIINKILGNINDELEH